MPGRLQTLPISGKRFGKPACYGSRSANAAGPDRAVVPCVDEKAQALNLSYAKGFTHDCIRLGPATRFASLHAATREVIARCAERHRHEECLTFLRLVDGLQSGRIVPSKASVVAARP